MRSIYLRNNGYTITDLKIISHEKGDIYHGLRKKDVDNFDFGDSAFWKSINSLSEELSTDKRIRKMNGNRGSKHFLYINRTFFGLYNLMFDLKAKDIRINNFINL